MKHFYLLVLGGLFAGYIIGITFQNLLLLPVVADKVQLPELIFPPLFLGTTLFFWRSKQAHTRLSWIGLDLAIAGYLLCFFCIALVHKDLSVWLEWVGLAYLAGFYTACRLWGALAPRLSLEYTELGVHYLGTIAAVGALIGIVSLYAGWDWDMGWRPERAYPYFGHIARSAGFTRHPNMLMSILGFCFLVQLAKTPSLAHFFRQNSTHLLLLGMLSTLSKSMLPVLIAGTWIALKRDWIKGLVQRRIAQAGMVVLTLAFVLLSNFLVLRDTSKQTLDDLIYSEGTFGTDQPVFYIGTYPVVETVYGLQKRVAWEGFWESPWAGVGYFTEYVERRRTEGRYPAHLNNLKPHGTWNGIPAQWGIFVFLAWLIWVFQIRQHILQLPLPEQILMGGVFLFFAIEATASDELNFRHLWVAISWLAMRYTFHRSPLAPATASQS